MSPKLTIIEVRNSVVKIKEENTEVINHKEVLGKNPKPQIKKNTNNTKEYDFIMVKK